MSQPFALRAIPAHADGERGAGTPPSNTPCQTINQPQAGVISGFFGSRGGRIMTSGAEGSSANAMAGKLSVISLSQRICSTPSGSGQPIMIAANTMTSSAKLHENK